jgi:hypothetical protein
MSRQSEYSDKDILRIIEENNYQRISGVHVNGASAHELLHSCGMVNVKTSKTLLGPKAGCRYIPCHARGTLSLLYLKKTAKEYGLDDVTHPLDGQVPLPRLEISAKEVLVWRKGSKTMTQSWHEVRARALSEKGGPFFQPDEERRKQRLPLTVEELAIQCEQKRLKPLGNALTQRKRKSEYVHVPCGASILLRHLEVNGWNENKCPTCSPVGKALLDSFREFLGQKEMEYFGSLEMLGSRKQVARNQWLVIRCSQCGHDNAPRTYDQIRYRGFAYCDNSNCKNTYSIEDVTKGSIEYYIGLFERHRVDSFSEAQQRFPKAARWIKRMPQLNAQGELKIGEAYRAIRDALGWDRNLLPKSFAHKELRNTFSVAIAQGAKTIGELRAMLPDEVNNYINRRLEQGDNIHHKILDELNFKYKRDIKIDNFEDAIEYIAHVGANSWSILVNKYPSAVDRIFELDLKEKIFTYFGWSSLAQFHKMSDADLLEEADLLCRTHNITTIDGISRIRFGLVKNIRRRNLIDTLIKRLGIQQTNRWNDFTCDSILEHVREQRYVSSTDWHEQSSGSYKHAAQNGWLQDIARACGWGEYKGIDEYAYGSIPETIVANLLYLSDIPFHRHPPITAFRGPKGGRLFADFRVADAVWIEVWAYQVYESPRSSQLSDYPEKRRYKESGYAENNIDLCSIEGGVFYRNYIIDGQPINKGLHNFIDHACQQLAKHGYPINLTNEFIDMICHSLQGQSDSASLRL